MPFQILVHHWYHTYRKISCNTASNLEETNSFAATILSVPIGQPYHIFNPAFHGNRFQFSFNHVRSENISHGTIFPAWYNNRDIFLSSGQHPTVFGVNFIILFQNTAQQHFIHVFMRKITLPGSFCISPEFMNMFLKSSESFFLRYTGIRNTVIMIFEQVPFFLWTQVAVIRHPLIMAMRHQVHDIFFQVGTRTTDNGYFILPDHFCETDSQLCCTHCARKAYQHFASIQQMGFISFSRIYQCCGIKMAILVLNKLRNRSFTHGICFEGQK